MIRLPCASNWGAGVGLSFAFTSTPKPKPGSSARKGRYCNRTSELGRNESGFPFGSLPTCSVTESETGIAILVRTGSSSSSSRTGTAATARTNMTRFYDEYFNE